MQNNYYEIYLNSVIELAETLIIKSEYSALQINKYLSLAAPGSFDPHDPRTWQYYKHLAGEYYEATDEPMTVTSLDTLENIVFSKTNLLTHRATARAYAYGSAYYRELVSRYPKQEALILGILYPVDIDKAIAASDFEIIGYPPHLIEPQEHSLISKLQKWVRAYAERWSNKQYRITDDLYEPAHVGIMYLQLVPTILAIRLEACKTPEAHSYHIHQYLASHGMLDRFIVSMTLKQKLFFYRNIRWIQRNAGRTENFEWLVRNLMTERGLPLVSFIMQHDTTNQIDELVPEVLFERRPENEIIATDVMHHVSVTKLLEKEDRIAPRNYTVRQHEEQAIQEAFTHSISNVVKTKALESSMYDYTDSTPYSFTDILLNHWLYLAVMGIYKSYCSFTNPKTGETIQLSAKDAYTFAMYLNCKTFGLELLTVPKVTAIRVQRIPTTSVSEILGMAEARYFDRAFVQDLLHLQPVIDPIISIDDFYSKCQEIYTAANYQRSIMALQEHYLKRSYVHGMISRIYCDKVCELEPSNTFYADWFIERNIEITDFEEESYPELYTSIVNQITGIDLDHRDTLKSLQRNMIQMLTELSSYSLQFLTEINNDVIRLIDWPAVRPGDMDQQIKAVFQDEGPVITVLDIQGELSHEVKDKVTCHSYVSDPTVLIYGSAEVELPNLVSSQPYIHSDRFSVDISKVTVHFDTIDESFIHPGIHPVKGIETYIALDAEARESVAFDIYN